MRILHTSDWHLGRSLLSVRMIDHQRDFLQWLVGIAEDRDVDAVLVSGDVYDRTYPSVEAVQLLQSALISLSDCAPVVLISGNHDSPQRLGFAGALLERAGVHFRSSLSDIDRPVVVDGEDDHHLYIYGLPYLEPELHAAELGCERSHESTLAAAMDRVRADVHDRETRMRVGALSRSIVLAHAFVTGGTESDSERDVRVGGIGDAPANVFDGVDYVALGHLHGPQQVHSGGSVTTLRYSGSPLPYSFSEENHVKSVCIVDFPHEGEIMVEVIPIPQPRRLVTIRGDIDKLLSDVGWKANELDWVRAVITDARRPADAMVRLRVRFPHALELRFEPESDGVPITMNGKVVDPRKTDDLEVAVSFVEHVTGTPATVEERDLLSTCIEAVRILRDAR